MTAVLFSTAAGCGRSPRAQAVRSLVSVALFTAASSLLSDSGYADAVIYRAAGVSAAELQTTMDQFRADIGLGGGDNGSLPGPISNGWREMNWEGIQPTSGSVWGDSIFLRSEGAFVQFYSFTQNPSTNLGAINPTYTDILKPFSGEALVAADATVHFFGPSTDAPSWPATVTAFGAVFVDVDREGSAYLSLWVPTATDPSSMLTYDAPASPGDSHYSFLGVRFDAGEQIMGVGIGSANGWLSPLVNDGEPLPNGMGIADVVAMDEVIFSEPQVPEPGTVLMLALGLVVLGVRALTRRWAE